MKYLYLILFTFILTSCASNQIKTDIFDNLSPDEDITSIWLDRKTDFSSYRTLRIEKFKNTKLLESKINRDLIDEPHIYLGKMLSHSRIPYKIKHERKEITEDLIFKAEITEVTQTEISIQFTILNRKKSKTILKALHTQQGINLTDSLEKLCSDITNYLNRQYFKR